MHTNEKWLQPDSWQRVVDGQLTQAELAELVTACDQRPELWKRCAVAFLEEQTLALELEQLAGNWPESPSDAACVRQLFSPHASALARRAYSAAVGETSHQRADVASPLPGHSQQRTTSRARWSNQLGLAALVLLSVGIGWQASERLHNERLHDDRWQATAGPGDEKNAGGMVVAGKGAPPWPVPATAEKENRGGGMQLAGAGTKTTESDRARRIDPDLVGTHSVDLAAVGAATIGTVAVGTEPPSAAITADAIEQALGRPEHFVPLDRRIPKSLAQLEQRGLLHIESIEGFVPVRLRDGNTAVVPVQQINLRPARNAY